MKTEKINDAFFYSSSAPLTLKCFCEKNGFARVGDYSYLSAPDIPRFLRSGRNQYAQYSGYYKQPFKGTTYSQPMPPGLDHTIYFSSVGGGKRVIVSQPYGNYSDLKTNLIKWSTTADLSADIYPKEHSWYFFSSTLIFLLHHKDVGVLPPGDCWSEVKARHKRMKKLLIGKDGTELHDVFLQVFPELERLPYSQARYYAWRLFERDLTIIGWKKRNDGTWISAKVKSQKGQ